jgi:hypothetical protein
VAWSPDWKKKEEGNERLSFIWKAKSGLIDLQDHGGESGLRILRLKMN